MATQLVERSSKPRVRKRAKKQPAKVEIPSGSLGEWLRYLVGTSLFDDSEWAPIWPPDAFAIAAAFLKRTGAYVHLVNGSGLRTWKKSRQASEVGKEWRQTLDEALSANPAKAPALRDSCPREISGWWNVFKKFAQMPLINASREPDVIAAANRLCIASDAASAGIGVVLDNKYPFLAMADAILTRNERRSFGLVITPDKLAVLGKQHTPQRGCTVRSLTHHLALYSPTEITASWSGPFLPASKDLDVLNLLLLPWPTAVHGTDFRMTAGERTNGQSDVSRYFEYDPESQGSRAMAQRVKRALNLAREHADRIHGIVFPELALSGAEYLAAEKVAIAQKAMLIAGVRLTARETPAKAPMNVCAIQPLGLINSVPRHQSKRTALWDAMRLTQVKHHRWCLDRNQILQYGLGGRLPASRECWERTHIGEREINFITLASWLTSCVLICEDLARQDPVGEVIRAVGPNLVFALLMDGPQLRSRWSSRYASVLAEDPGCSVLTMTSLGMVKRSRRKDEEQQATKDDSGSVVALWRDAVYGEKEIRIPNGHDACVLSLVCRTTHEYTIDGRTDHGAAHFPVFAGYYSFDSTERNRRGGKY